MLKQVLEIAELLDSARVSGALVADLFALRGWPELQVEPVSNERGSTDFVKTLLPGLRGRSRGGDAPTLGVIGYLGGIGARPERVGLVSDADGAIAALAVALKLVEMRNQGDVLAGDVIVTTHVCPRALIIPHDPVPFMASPIDVATMNRYSVDPRMEAILSLDTTRGNRIINQRGFAISPTVKEGYILRVSEDLLGIMQVVTGRPPAVFAITTQDITPYSNDLYHLNTILQPATATTAPVVGVAITAEVAVPGAASGATQEIDIELAARFAVEVAKAFGQGRCAFYDAAEYERLVRRYGSLAHLQTLGRSE